ncbi:MAG: RCC1 domain-containing protein [Dehalococcoidia bacterium]|nr:RCC1 domain-containing protein [Dehalococcoidia bacterium]MDH4291287.1 RCC1 domain-containing protein [Dehalococcoidia bacterium]
MSYAVYRYYNLSASFAYIPIVQAGGRHTLGLKNDGTVIAVGYNSHGQCNVSSW